ncbi:MAG: hypothetical protein K0S07_1004 [Chlamydiales bacterium]|jgi:hypothetical protein|nr:hypothetical protein [Chlamydiales bacterium]
MAKRKKIPPPDFETLMPLLVGIWRKINQESGPLDRLLTREFRSLVSVVEKLDGWTQLKPPTEFPATPWYEDKKQFSAYLLYHFVMHYLEGRSLIGELEQTPDRVLDISKGAAPFALAALEMGANVVTALDRSTLGLKIGSEISGRLGHALSLRQLDTSKLERDLESKAFLLELDHLLYQEEPYDLIIAGHIFSDLFRAHPNEAQALESDVVNYLMGKLAPNGRLLIVESSHQAFNHRLLSLRDGLLDQGYSIEAPCIFRGKCPALAAKSLCFAQRAFEKPYLIKEIQRAASIHLDSLKMSYLIIKNEAGLPLQEGAYRVISPRLEGPGTSKYYLCGGDGKKTLEMDLKETPIKAKAFDFLKRGDVVLVKNGAIYKNRIVLEQDSELTVEAAAGKPIANKLRVI